MLVYSIPKVESFKVKGNNITQNTSTFPDQQGESAHTLVLTVKTKKLEIVFFLKFDTKFGPKSIKLV
jgi:hypothetical protein